ncbi:MAG: hypothetical protein SCABRO_03555 [Candidatus Scalindua brodae]|uniref:Uncharacterized protein n=1 Tax=Candidatus Scalindua brodae TaxID=237368 RepID=A0A0B0EJ40_9BACT|nr:MAG: hypothetical protein SCABRO_03555 [Candidatus Scalindua brodae]
MKKMQNSAKELVKIAKDNKKPGAVEDVQWHVRKLQQTCSLCHKHLDIHIYPQLFEGKKSEMKEKKIPELVISFTHNRLVNAYNLMYYNLIDGLLVENRQELSTAIKYKNILSDYRFSLFPVLIPEVEINQNSKCYTPVLQSWQN